MKTERKCPNCKKRMKFILAPGSGIGKRICLQCGFPDKEKMALREKRKKPIRITMIRRVLKGKDYSNRPVIKKGED